MSPRGPYWERRCPACAWNEVYGTEGMIRALAAAGKIRPGREPEVEILLELFRVFAEQQPCPQCGATGLTLRDAADDVDWPEARACAACRRPIAAERLAALPQATLCAACQRDEELGRAPAEVDYCPRCGAPMELRPSRSAGITRYELVCTSVPPCRR